VAAKREKDAMTEHLAITPDKKGVIERNALITPDARSLCRPSGAS
jgi:hypothetical protein